MSENDLSNFLATCKVDICADEAWAKAALDQFLATCANRAAIQSVVVDAHCANLSQIQQTLTGDATQCSGWYENIVIRI